MDFNTSALVIFSGGQDSTTCLGWALERFQQVKTIGFHYGQRHAVEMDCRKTIRDAVITLRPLWQKRLSEDWTTDISIFQEIGGTSLTDSIKFEMGSKGLPNTFVPGRNLIFLSVAAAYAYRQGIRDIVIGVCETDFSGYPDCRDDAMKAMQIALNIGMDCRFTVHTPLMWLDKAQMWGLSHTIGGDDFVDVIVEHSHTCYEGDRTHRHSWGYGCGQCPACKLRAKGFETYKTNY